MIQEYLFVTDTYKNEIESLEVNSKILKETIVIENSKCWIFSLQFDGENEDAARALDAANKAVFEKYTPIILSNGSSAYFNKSLFPIVNEFERKLRKLLYLASALQDEKDSGEAIKDLEAKDLGTIFTALFSDASFVKKVKETINKNMTWQFTKDELLHSIKELDENVLWDTLLGKDCAQTFRKEFNTVKGCRNDVMHAHNINFDQYKTAKKLFQKINGELDSAIGQLIGAKEENKPVAAPDFSSTIVAALTSLQDQMDIHNLIPNIDSLRNALKVYPAISPELSESISGLSKAVSSMYIENPNYLETISQLRGLSKIQKDILPATDALRKMSEQMTAYKMVIPPEVVRLQDTLSNIKFDVSGAQTHQDEKTEEN